jgi:hypothetical protein
MYGTENMEAARIHQSLLNDARKQGEENAFARFQEARRAEIQEQAQYQEFIDGELESLEDEFNVDLTSDAPAARKARRELLGLVANLSPKDEAGQITGYADFRTTYDLLQSRRTPEKSETTNRAKEIAARSMEKSGTGATPPKQPTPGFYGWMKDFGQG